METGYFRAKDRKYQQAQGRESKGFELIAKNRKAINYYV
jgi:hypothetical protein